jgi:hypothetical protein
VTRVLTLLVALLLFGTPAIATARQTNAPPGNSAIDEYLETVPEATGNGVPKPPGAGAAATPLTPAQRARLQRLGPDGKTLANVIDGTSPARATPSKGTADALSAKGRSPIGGILDAGGGHDGGGGMGVVLPAILLVSLLGIVALVVLRRRRTSSRTRS